MNERCEKCGKNNAFSVHCLPCTDAESARQAIRLERDRIRQLLRKLEAAHKLLRKAQSAINEELNAAGEDEVEQHAILRDHRKVADRIEKYLSR